MPLRPGSSTVPGLLVALTLLPGVAWAQAGSGSPASEEAELCLGCHGEKDLTLDLPSGESQSLYVDGTALAHSVHKGLRCTDCHAGTDEVPHPERPFKDRREFRASFREVCKSCHFDNYTKTLDSVHYRLLARGDVEAPSCLSCHGGHDITPPAEPRSRISHTCATCHEGVYNTYAKSVHGRALLEEANADVPVCTDCHRSHDIEDPRQGAWLLATPRLCGHCHADKKLMGKYGLSTSVVNTYLADFHGVTASLAEGSEESRGRVTALCIDCHGVHDITRVNDPNSRVLKANLVKTCQKCHPGASRSFPAAWLSHYEPTWRRAPLVYVTRVFYAIFIPFVIGGLILQILLHLWRVVVNR